MESEKLTTSVFTLNTFLSRKDSGAIHLSGSLAGAPGLPAGSLLSKSIARPKSATLTTWLSVSLKDQVIIHGYFSF